MTEKIETDSDAEYENLAKEYEQIRGVKLPSRHTGSASAKIANKARSGLPRQRLDDNATKMNRTS